MTIKVHSYLYKAICIIAMDSGYVGAPPLEIEGDASLKAQMDRVEKFLLRLTPEELTEFAIGDRTDIDKLTDKYEYGTLASAFLDELFDGHLTETFLPRTAAND